MVISDLIVGDIAEFYYFCWHQQLLRYGTVVSISDDTVVFDIGEDCDYIEVPKNHLVYRRKRKEEQEAELRQQKEEHKQKIEENRYSHINGARFVSRKDKQVLIDCLKCPEIKVEKTEEQTVVNETIKEEPREGVNKHGYRHR